MIPSFTSFAKNALGFGNSPQEAESRVTRSSMRDSNRAHDDSRRGTSHPLKSSSHDSKHTIILDSAPQEIRQPEHIEARREGELNPRNGGRNNSEMMVLRRGSCESDAGGQVSFGAQTTMSKSIRPDQPQRPFKNDAGSDSVQREYDASDTFARSGRESFDQISLDAHPSHVNATYASAIGHSNQRLVDEAPKSFSSHEASRKQMQPQEQLPRETARLADERAEKFRKVQLARDRQARPDGRELRPSRKEVELERIIRSLEEEREKHQAEIRRLKNDRASALEKYEKLVVKQQEESFKQMSSAQWLPIEDRKIIAELERIKREIRTWAKANAINSMEILRELDPPQSNKLLLCLSQVAVLKDGCLPEGLSTPKTPALLLNALLAHHLYATTFRSPFFFFESAMVDKVDLLQLIHKLAEESCEEDTHAWRSQTLRLLHPALGSNMNDGGKFLRGETERLVAKASKYNASEFTDGAAQYLMAVDKLNLDSKTKLKGIYHDAAKLSYRLWTQKTNLKCTTLAEMAIPGFNADSKYFKPHTLVRYEDHEDNLKGRPITLMVHPLLLAYGSDEGTDYHGDPRVWAHAEVWLNSK